MMKIGYNKILLLITLSCLILACQNDSRPNYQFMPNMYEPIGYETYGQYDVFPNNGQSALLPAEGTIARGFSLYDYENTEEDYTRAKVELINPLDSTQIDPIRAKELYTIYCGICHGNNGKGQGALVKNEKILGIPSYADENRNITEGSVYHVIYYGRNTMGSYAGQLSEEERWQVTAYVMQLKADIK